MIDVLRRTIQKYNMLSPGDTIVIGCSGGADSVALLRGFCAIRAEMNLTLYAAHIHHGLRDADADTDAAFVAALCEAWQIPLSLYQANVRGLAQEARLSLEEAGRRWRYHYFNEAMTLHSGNKIAVAHNRDDNAETVLMNICRGTGLKGLCGIPPVRGAVIRPLIETPRKAIEAFLAAQQQPYRTDQSNYETVYTRNRIRLTVMPALEKSSGVHVGAAITRTTALLSDDEAYLHIAAQAAYEETVVKQEMTKLQRTEQQIKEHRIEKASFENQETKKQQGIMKVVQTETYAAIWLNAAKLASLHPAMARRVLREAFKRVSGSATDISAMHTEQVRALADGQTGRRIVLPKGLRAQRIYERIKIYKEYNANGHRFSPSEMNPDKNIPDSNSNAATFDESASGELNPNPIAVDTAEGIRLTPGKTVTLPGISLSVTISLENTANDDKDGCTKEFRYDKINTTITLRTRRPGDFIYFEGLGRRKLQDYFTDRKLPRAQRDLIPLLADGSEILWIMDEQNRINGRYKPKIGSASIWVTAKQ